MINNTLDLSNNTPSLATSAMLVELSISSWGGNKLDKNASKKVTDDNGADTAVARLHKSLLHDCEPLINIKRFIGEARNHVHYHLTMPWSDTGIRLLPTELFFEYQNQITHYEGLIYAEVDTLIENFELEKAKAAYKLGTLFNPEDYPTAESLRDKFTFRVSYMPLPDAGDFRLDIGNDAVRELQEKYEAAYTEKVNAAMGDIWQRVYTSLNNMSERLGYDDNGKKLIFRDSLVDNALTMVDLLRKCNVTGSTQMTAMADKLENALLGVSADSLREDGYFRDETKKSIDDILKQLPSLDF